MKFQKFRKSYHTLFKKDEKPGVVDRKATAEKTSATRSVG